MTNTMRTLRDGMRMLCVALVVTFAAANLYAGNTDDTARLQALLDAGKGRVEFPDGTLVISKTLFIGSDTHLVCSPRTVLRLADGSNCPLLCSRGSEPGGRARNITIEGGIWDGNNVHQKRGAFRFPNMPGGGDINQLMVFAGVCNLKITGVTYKDPDSYCVELTDIDGFRISDIVFDCNDKTPNQDGIHIDGYARDGYLTNLRGHTNDDLVALNSDEGNWRSPQNDIENITIDGIYGGDNGYTAVRLLSRNAHIRNVVIRNVYGKYKYNGVSFTHWADEKSYRHGMGHFDNIVLENIFASSCQKARHGKDWGIVLFQKGVESVGRVTIRNLSREDAADCMNLIHTINIQDGVKIRSLTLENVWQSVPDGKPLIYRAPTAVVGSLVQKAAPLRVSTLGFDAADSTRFLQAAFDSGAAKVVIDRQASDWITRPLFITNSNIEVVLEDGVTLKAKRGEFHGLGDTLVTITRGASNVTVRGEGAAKLAMWKKDYQNPALGYDHSEWRHAVSILNARDVTVRDLTILSSGGDGVYVNGPRRVTLENLTVLDHHRQGMSPISVEGMTVRRCTFNETRGTAPQSGIDMEPNHEHNRFTDVVYEDCVFNGNASHGIDMHLGWFTRRTKPASVTYRRCLSRGNGSCGFSLLAGSPSLILERGANRGYIRFEDCRFERNGSVPIKIMNHVTNGMDLSFANCRFDARGAKAESVFLLSNSQLAADFGGLRFENCEILKDAGMQAFAFEAPSGIGIAGRLAGDVAIVEGERRTPFDLAAFQARHVPHPEQVIRFKSAAVNFRSLAAPDGSLEERFSPVIRDRFVYVQAVPKAGEYPIRFKSTKLRKGGLSKTCAVVQLMDAAGTDLGTFDVPEGDFTYTLKAHGPGVFRFQIGPRNTGLIRLASATPGGAFLCDQSFGFFHGSNVNLHFRVPKGAKEVLVDMRPEEKVSAQLIDPTGNVVDAMPLQGAGKVLKAAFAERTADEVWTLRFPYIQEDFRFQIGGDAVPLCSLDRAGVIRAK